LDLGWIYLKFKTSTEERKFGLRCCGLWLPNHEKPFDLTFDLLLVFFCENALDDGRQWDMLINMKLTRPQKLQKKRRKTSPEMEEANICVRPKTAALIPLPYTLSLPTFLCSISLEKEVSENGFSRPAESEDHGK